MDPHPPLPAAIPGAGGLSFPLLPVHRGLALRRRRLIDGERCGVEDDALVSGGRLRGDVAAEDVESHLLDGPILRRAPSPAAAGLAGDDVIAANG